VDTKEEEAPMSTESESHNGHGVTDDPFNCTELGNAQRLVRKFGPRMRYCHPWKKWLVWDERRWELDNVGVARSFAKQTIEAIYQDAAHEPDKRRKALRQWALKSESDSAYAHALSIAQSEPGIPVLPEHFDQNPMLLNTKSGILDLRTGALSAHDPAQLITKLAPVVVDPDAACPVWLAFLHRIMDGDVTLIDYLQRAAGYTLTGLTGEECFFLLYGSGRNGKSKFLETLGLVMGDYGQPTEFSTFLHRRSEAVRNDIADLRGARFVAASETKESKELDESVLKSLTGGDRIRARFLFQEYFTFTPLFKLWLSTNHLPQINADDLAIWERIHLVPFRVYIPEDERDPDLLDKFRAELPGIFNWMLAGCELWREQRLRRPQVVIDATAAYRRDVDTIGAFLADCTTPTPNARLLSSVLYHAYASWAKDNGILTPFSHKALTTKLRDRGLPSTRLTQGVYWLNLALSDHTM
jgi:putative DNA primase/helicase